MIWENLLTVKVCNRLGIIQHNLLEATTGAYQTFSTNALQALAGVLPLDLKIKETGIRQKLAAGLIDEQTSRAER